MKAGEVRKITGCPFDGILVTVTDEEVTFVPAVDGNFYLGLHTQAAPSVFGEVVDHVESDATTELLLSASIKMEEEGLFNEAFLLENEARLCGLTMTLVD